MRLIPLACAAVVCTVLALPAAAQPDKGHGKGGGGGPPPHAQGGGGSPSGGSYSGGQGQGRGGPDSYVVPDRDRNTVYSYYRTEYSAGHCPPGLAKKNNGCLPPGQAKKLWAIGQPLPGSVVFYPLPGPLLLQLTPAPTGYQYVRVANDILLMVVGTRMITAAIADLSSF